MAFFDNFYFYKLPFMIIIILFFSLNPIKCDNTTDTTDTTATTDTYNKTIGEKCSSNLECNSACCSSDKCSDTSKCEKLVRIVYIAEAALCFVFIIIFTIYLVIKLKKIKEDFQKKTSTEEEKKQN